MVLCIEKTYALIAASSEAGIGCLSHSNPQHLIRVQRLFKKYVKTTPMHVNTTPIIDNIHVPLRSMKSGVYSVMLRFIPRNLSEAQQATTILDLQPVVVGAVHVERPVNLLTNGTPRVEFNGQLRV